jgi:hypothetical protein
MMTTAIEGNRSMNEKKHNAPPAKHPLREPSIAQGDVVLLGGPAMAYNEGWIKLHRSVRDSVLWKKPLSRMDAWIDLIMTARWLDKPSTVLVGATQRISCERGELITSQEALAKQWGWSRSKVKRFIDALEADQMVNTNSTHNSTKITICNYDTYQDARTPIEQQSSGNRAAIEQQSSSNRTHNKKDKNERREEGKKESAHELDLDSTSQDQVSPQEVPNTADQAHIFRTYCITALGASLKPWFVRDITLPFRQGCPLEEAKRIVDENPGILVGASYDALVSAMMEAAEVAKHGEQKHWSEVIRDDRERRRLNTTGAIF